ncbi:FAD:protein FMN transferase [Microbacterium sp. Se63.02b]|uniref:FAD:protein FMN transferase n=1 Tax=Microbacterium sp. Se63.02b TaxID=2709304 RepID=UPI0031F71298
MASWRFEAIGTHWDIESTVALTEADRTAVSAEVERFDREWSRFRPDSEVTRLGTEGGAFASTDAGPMLDAYRALSAATDGAVNPLVAVSLAAIGYDAEYSLVPGSPCAPPRTGSSGWRGRVPRSRSRHRRSSTSGRSERGASSTWS